MKYITKERFCEALEADNMCRIVHYADNADHKTLWVVGAGDALNTKDGQLFVSLFREMYEQVGKARFVKAFNPNGQLTAIDNSVYAFRKFFLEWYYHFGWIDREKFENLKGQIREEALNARS